MVAQPEAPATEVGWFQIGEAFDVRTKAVSRDEFCFFLGEYNLPSRSGKSMSRYQLLRVVRGDRLVTAYVYLGPAKSFDADQFQMLGGLVMGNGRGMAVHTVGELQDGADEMRSRPAERFHEPSDLQGAYRNYQEEKGRRARHASTFGSGVAVQR